MYKWKAFKIAKIVLVNNIMILMTGNVKNNWIPKYTLIDKQMAQENDALIKNKLISLDMQINN